jgi:threonylcarbamoyladenosine tRNA methylthiotransferase MtaB
MSQPIATFKVVSFGCKVNQTEGLALADRLRRRGLTEVGRRARADLVIVNTCCVTAEAARQGRQQIRRARRRGTAVAVTGCAAHAASGDAALARIEGLAAMDADRDRLLARLVETGCVPDAPVSPTPGQERSQWPGSTAGSTGGQAASGTRRTAAGSPSQPRSRAMLKVQDGCPGGCAYCIVPKVRPEVRSVPPEDAARQAEALVAEGFREVVVCGIHLGLYGADLASSSTLAGLMERLLAVEGLGRLRLSSILPTEVDAALLALMAAEPERLCPHLHLSLQSGDDAVLAQMGRPYTAAAFLETLARVRAALDQPAITTDVLVGFPGETDAAFERTLAVCREAGFARMHVFPFSARPGTRAADMPGRVPREVARERRGRATEVGEDLAAVYRRRLVGRREQVVLETVSGNGPAEGVAARYVRVRMDGPLPDGAVRRDLVPVRLEGIEGEALAARAET